MENKAVQEALVQQKRMRALLNEMMDLTRQLAEAVDRGDQVTIRLLLSMRGEPLERLRGVRRILEQQRDALPPEDGARLAQLLNGQCAPQDGEQVLAEQVAASRRLLEQLVALDRVVNQKLGRDHSIYNKKTDTSPARG